MTRFTAIGARAPPGEIEDLLRRVQEFARNRGGDAQLLDASAVFGREHLRSAFDHAVRAQERGTSVASSLPVEFLRYAAGERRIDRAIERIGAKRGAPVVVVAFGRASAAETLKAGGLSRDDRVLSAAGKSLRRFGITADEEHAVPPEVARDLILERVALTDLVR